MTYPLFGFDYWPMPHSPMDWVFVFGFVILAAGVAFDRAGFLAAWWVNIPAHVAMSHYVYSSGFVHLPFQNDFLSYLVIAAMIAFVYGVLGYFIGQAGRWWFDRATFSDPSSANIERRHE